MTAGRSARALMSAVILAGLGGWVGGEAAEHPAGLIKYRQFVMQQTEASMGAMTQFMEGKIDFRPAFAEQAAAVAATAKELGSLFPPGSDTGAKTNAKPDVWAQNMRFRGAGMRFAQEAQKLADAAKAGDADGFKAQFQNVVDRCNACHENFRFPL